MWGSQDDKRQDLVSEDDGYTFFGKGTVFTGKASFGKTVVRMNGQFEGDVVAEDTLILGECAVVKGTITCETLVCQGRVEGQIHATKHVQLVKPAVLVGDVHSPALAIEDGVFFNGQCAMEMSMLDERAARAAERPETVWSPGSVQPATES